MLNFIDLFAGAGGLSLGFELAGYKPVFALELDKWAALTYGTNHPEVPLWERDITDVAEREIKQLSDLAPDLIIGGPPCQGFSHSNIVNRDLRDPRNSLFQDFLRFVQVLQPQAFLIENVPGLLKTRTKSGRRVINIMASSCRALGYDCQWKILEASAFGVPQKRQRLFVLGFKAKPPLNFCWPEPTHGSQTAFDLFASRELASELSLWQAISDLPQCTADTFSPEQTYSTPPQNTFQELMRSDAPRVLHNHEPMRHTRRIVNRFAEIGFGLSEADVRSDLKPRKRGAPAEQSSRTYDQNSRRQHPNLPCNTIVASSHTNFVHPFLNRNFTVRELMRIQSFPDAYIACGKRAVLSKKLSLRKGLIDDIYLDQRSQIGNAVPPLLAKALADAIAAAVQHRTKSDAA